MDSNGNKKNKLTKWGIAAVLLCIVVFVGLQNFGSVLSTLQKAVGIVAPLLAGAAIAAVLNVPMKSIESVLWKKAKKKFLIKLRRPVAMLLSVILVLAVIVGVVLLVIPELVEAFKVIFEIAVKYVDKLSGMTEKDVAALPFGNYLLKIDWTEALSSFEKMLKNNVTNILNVTFGTVKGIFGGIFDFFIALIFSLYLLSSKEMIKAQAKRLVRAWVNEGAAEWILNAGSTLKSVFRNFVLGQSLEAVVLGTLCMLGMFILRIPYAPMVGALVGVTALVPVVGAFIGAFVGAFMILTQDPVKAVVFIVFLILLQQFEGNIIYPKVMGNRVNLPAMWILASVTVGGGIAGPLGMLLAVPLASTAYVLVRQATEKRELNKKVQICCAEKDIENTNGNKETQTDTKEEKEKSDKEKITGYKTENK